MQGSPLFNLSVQFDCMNHMKVANYNYYDYHGQMKLSVRKYAFNWNKWKLFYFSSDILWVVKIPDFILSFEVQSVIVLKSKYVYNSLLAWVEFCFSERAKKICVYTYTWIDQILHS